MENLGGVAAASIGVDYYVTQWLGLFIEYSARYNHIALFTKKDILKKPYSYSTTALSIGIKTTF
jgi:hypothetical protein